MENIYHVYCCMHPLYSIHYTSVEAYPRINGPDTGRNSGGRQIIIKKKHLWTFWILTVLANKHIFTAYILKLENIFPWFFYKGKLLSFWCCAYFANFWAEIHQALLSQFSKVGDFQTVNFSLDYQPKCNMLSMVHFIQTETRSVWDRLNTVHKVFSICY